MEEKRKLNKKTLKFAFAGLRHGHILSLIDLLNDRADVEVLGAFDGSEEGKTGGEKRGIVHWYSSMSDLLAEEADFFSIGSNDLTQYVMAADRGNPAVARYHDPLCAPMRRIIKTIISDAHRHGIPVGICGELAADATATAKLIEMGVDELSVTPMHLPAVRKAIRDCEA